MQDILKHFEVNGRNYPLIFNLNVMETIQDKYKSIKNWGELTDGKENEVDVKALKFGIREMINEGIDIENEDKDVEQKEEFLTDKQVGRLITTLGVQKISEKTQEIIIDSTKVEQDEKNV